MPFAIPPVEMIGLAAAAMTTGSFLPQAIKTIRTRDTRSISLGMYMMMTIGVALWLGYGIAVGSLSLILANGFTLIQSALILALKYRHG
ncbi:MAG TPA: SemiSWEET transporter [Alphaproteobacteria bacterium]|nr:SemiSWEET transporter [Alphaproteobacteria bacterium]